MIEVKSLYKSFEDKEVLKDINSVFENGKVIYAQLVPEITEEPDYDAALSALK